MSSQFGSLFQKNFKIWQKGLVGLVWELFTLFLFIGLLVYIGSEADKDEKTVKQNMGSFGIPVSPPNQRGFPDNYNEFRSQLLEIEQALGFEIGGFKKCDMWHKVALAPKTGPIIDKLKVLLEVLDYKVLLFEDKKAIKNFVEADVYGQHTSTGINDMLCFGISFEESDMAAGKWKYSMHYNFTSFNSDLPSFDKALIQPFIEEDFDSNLNMIKSGLPILQNFIDSEIMRQSVVDALAGKIDLKLHSNPHAGYKHSLKFSYTNKGQIDVYIVFPILVIFLRFISATMREKEEKIKGNLLNMGMSIMSYYGSWLIFYTIILAVFSLIWSSIMANTLFPLASMGLLFAFFFAFALNFLSFGFFMISFFDKSKPAIVTATVVFFLFMLLGIAQGYVQASDNIIYLFNLSPV